MKKFSKGMFTYWFLEETHVPLFHSLMADSECFDERDLLLPGVVGVIADPEKKCWDAVVLLARWLAVSAGD